MKYTIEAIENLVLKNIILVTPKEVANETKPEPNLKKISIYYIFKTKHYQTKQYKFIPF